MRGGAGVVEVRLRFPPTVEIAGVWVPSAVERRAAWEFYVELQFVARDPVSPDVIARVVLDGFHSVAAVTREILRKYGPDIAAHVAAGRLTLGGLMVAVVNGSISPLWNRWHPLLAVYEAARVRGADPVDHENGWEHIGQLRGALAAMQEALSCLAVVLGTAARADLRIPDPAPHPQTAV